MCKVGIACLRALCTSFLTMSLRRAFDCRGGQLGRSIDQAITPFRIAETTIGKGASALLIVCLANDRWQIFLMTWQPRLTYRITRTRDLLPSRSRNKALLPLLGNNNNSPPSILVSPFCRRLGYSACWKSSLSRVDVYGYMFGRRRVENLPPPPAVSCLQLQPCQLGH